MMFTLLKNAAMFSPQPLGVGHLLICGSQIVSLGKELPGLPAALKTEVVDLEGRRVIPGLIDAHVHVTGGGGESGPQSRVPPLLLTQYTRFGVTTVVGLLGTDDVTRTTSSLITQVRGINAEGLTAYCYTGGYHLPLMTLTGSVKGDIVHVEQIIGVGELAISDHRSSQPTLEEFLRIASEAYVASLMTGKAGVVHLHMGDGKRGLELVRQALATAEIPARIYQPTHCNRNQRLFEEACALTEKGCSIDLTAFPVPKGSHATWAHEALIRYWDAGLAEEKVTVSSDAGGSLPHFNEQGELLHLDVGKSDLMIFTIQELLKKGVPLEKSLPPLTSNVARNLRLARKGQLTVGSDADLAVLDHKNNITDVMALGRWHLRGGKTVLKGMFETPV